MLRCTLIYSKHRSYIFYTYLAAVIITNFVDKLLEECHPLKLWKKLWQVTNKQIHTQMLCCAYETSLLMFVSQWFSVKCFQRALLKYATDDNSKTCLLWYLTCSPVCESCSEMGDFGNITRPFILRHKKKTKKTWLGGGVGPGCSGCTCL